MTPHSAAGNPYAPTDADLSRYGHASPATQEESPVSPVAVEALRRTRFWVMVLAVLGSITCGIMILTGIGVEITVAGGRKIGGGGGTLFGVVSSSAALGLLFLWPVIRMFQFSAAISQLARQGGAGDLEHALRCQQVIWKFVALLTLLFLVSSVLQLETLAKAAV